MNHNGQLGIESTKILYTENLEQFSVSDLNRDVDMRHVARLKKSIAERNMLADYPLLVSGDNVIIDGQHRWEAAKALGVGVYFKKANATDWGTLGMANSAVKRWSLDDYLNYWCAQEHNDYLKFREFKRKYSFLGTSTILKLAANWSGVGYGTIRTSESLRIRFESGHFDATVLPQVARKVMLIQDYAQFYQHWRRMNFVVAVVKIMAKRDYDHKRMMHQLEQYGETVRIQNAAKVDDYIRQLEYAYNYQRKGKFRVSFI